MKNNKFKVETSRLKLSIINCQLSIILLAILTVSCSDYNDYNSVPTDANPLGNATIWENIKANGQLQNFAKLVEQTGFAENLNTSRYYTVWAPLDGTYDSATLLEIGNERLLKEFVKNHIADFNHPVSGMVDERLFTLNEKMHVFTNTAFDEAEISETNIGCSNGVIHTLNGLVPFYYNMYEYLDYVEGCDKVVKYLKSFEQTTLDEHASVKGPIVDGVQTWLDSVMVTTNTFITHQLNANVTSEDSTYTMLIPTDEAWEASYNSIKSCYNYLKTFDWQNFDLISKEDSRSASAISPTSGAETVTMDAAYWSDSLVCKNIVNNLYYNNNEAYNQFLIGQSTTQEVKDTMLSTTGRLLTNREYVVSKTIDSPVRMSNGYVRKVDSLAFYPWETYNPMLTTRTIARTYQVKGDIASRESILRSNLDPISQQQLDPKEVELTYIKAEPSSNSGKPEVDFYLKNVRSTAYNIYLVMVPACVENNTIADNLRLPYALRCDLSYTDASGKLKSIRLYGDEAHSSKSAKEDTIKTNRERIDTIPLGQFTFPICYYGLDAAPNIKVSHLVSTFTATNRKKYEQILRVANVILVPVEEDKFIEERKED